MRLTLDNTVTPTSLRHLAVSHEDLEMREQAAMHSELCNIEQEEGGSNDGCS